MWRLAWVSPAIKVAIGKHDDERLGAGRHYLAPATRSTRRRATVAARLKSLIDRLEPEDAVALALDPDRIR